MPKRWAVPIFLFALALFSAFFLFPLFETIRGGFVDVDGRFTAAYLREAVTNPIYRQSFFNSLLLATLTTLTALALALPLAFFSCRYEFPLKRIFSAIVLVPMILPPFVGAIGIMKVFGTHGVLNAILFKLHSSGCFPAIDWLGHHRLGGVVFFQALNLYPILFLNISAALANVDPAQEEAAANLGCTGLRRFWHITMPLIRPGLFAGLTIVFIWSFTELGVPLIFNCDRLLPVQIYGMLKELGSNPFPYALATVVLGCSTSFYLLGKKILGRESVAEVAKASHASSQRPISTAKKILCVSLFFVVVSCSLLPHVVVLLYSFAGDWFGTILPSSWTLKNYAAALGHPLAVAAIRNSICYAGCATLATVVLGTAIALVIVRSRLIGRGLLDTVAMLPLAVPGIIIAFGYLAISQRGRLFSFLNPVANPAPLLVIAYGIRKMPFMVRSAVAGLQQTSPTYEEAAASLGSPPVRTYLRITIPLIFGNLIAGGLLVFSQTMMEVSDSLIIAQKQQFYPITKAIYELVNLIGIGPYLACALGVWSMAFLAATLFAMSHFLGENMGAIFRA
ncbi:MAG: iron ABC transporter permease [Puniceicoccales bacterium]|jgi:iron(III) transport system permease protein|nr:iron ABC transporter permease [Puniceicoccales bacterium]